MPNKIEKRFFPISEIRAEMDDEEPRITGHAAVFNVLSGDLGGFREKIVPGAFARALTGDVLALWNHDTGLVLGRTSAGTLELQEDERGLAFNNKPPAAQWVRDRMESIRRGDVTGASFAFEVERDEWEEGRDGEPALRTIHEFRALHEVSPGVAFPAYPQTDVALRSLEAWREENKPEPPGRSVDFARREVDIAEAV